MDWNTSAKFARDFFKGQFIFIWKDLATATWYIFEHTWQIMMKHYIPG